MESLLNYVLMVGLEDGIFLQQDIMDLFVSLKAIYKKVHNTSNTMT